MLNMNQKQSIQPQIGIMITSKCNFNCNWCFSKDQKIEPTKDMTFEEFKKIVEEIKNLSKQTGVKYKISISGGEPFLNPAAEKIINYATQTLGNEQVSVTTNLSLFPTNEKKTRELLLRLGRPIIDCSIDAEHLKFGKNVVEKIIALRKASTQTRTKVRVITVTTNPSKKLILPREIKQALGFKLRFNSQVRTEFFSHPQSQELYDYLQKASNGKKVQIPNYALRGLGLHVENGKIRPPKIEFFPNGKIYIASILNAIHFPQLAIGSWKSEKLYTIINTNLPFKLNQIKNWFGLNESQSGLKKKRLFAKYGLNRFERLKKKRTKKI